MKKRLISLALLLAVVLSCWTVTAAAAYTPRYTAYADALYELGLFQGAGTLPSGKPDYRLDRTITRAESIVMLLRLLGESDEAATAKDTTPFTDIKGHWAASYIAYAYEKGYTNGTSTTAFSPNRAASGKMYLTYLLRALGYDDGAGDFSYNTAHETAARLGLCAEGAYGSGTFYRDDCVYTSYQALRCRTKAVDFTRPGGTSSIPDGTYSLKLTSEFTDVSGGVMAKGHVQELITFTDAEVQSLRPGDVLPLSRYAYTGPEYDGMYRYEDIALKTVTPAASGTRIFLNEELWLVKEDDGLWYLEAPSGAYYEVLTKAVEVYIPNTCPIVDWSTNQEQRPDSIRKVAKSALWYGGEFKIENGSVTNVRIYYNFNA